MFVQAMTKKKFGESIDAFVNVDQIVKVEVGHDSNVNITTSDKEELVVNGDHAKKLMEFIAGAAM